MSDDDLVAELRALAAEFGPVWSCPWFAAACSPDKPHADCGWVHPEASKATQTLLTSAADRIDAAARSDAAAEPVPT